MDVTELLNKDFSFQVLWSVIDWKSILIYLLSVLSLDMSQNEVNKSDKKVKMESLCISLSAKI